MPTHKKPSDCAQDGSLNGLLRDYMGSLPGTGEVDASSASGGSRAELLDNDLSAHVDGSAAMHFLENKLC